MLADGAPSMPDRGARGDAPRGAAERSDVVSLALPANPSALKNPLKGWRGQINRYAWGSRPVVDTVGGGVIPDSQPIWDVGEGENLESVRKWYVHWDELEAPGESEASALDRIRACTERYLGSMPARNMKAVPRLEVFTKDGVHIPADLPLLEAVTVDGVCKAGDREHPWWERPDVQSRLLTLVRRLGEVWDDDPRIAAVQVGTQGKYGEMWGLGKMPAFERFLGEAYSSAFKNKKLMIRTSGPYSWSNSRRLAESGPYGFYLDSFAFRGNEFGKTREPEMTSVLNLDAGNRWKVAPIGGEAPIKASHRNRKRVTRGIFEDADTRSYMNRCIRYCHMSWLGSCEGEQLAGGSREVIHSFHKSMGYRFVLQRSIYSRRVAPDCDLIFGFDVINSGSAPFLYDWPVVASLVDADRKVVWRRRFPVDIRTWLPGSDYDLESGSYRKPPQLYHERTRFGMADATELPSGRYTICIFVEDPFPPAQAAVRFANYNYWEGGLHPVGRVVWKSETSAADMEEPGFGEFYVSPVDKTLGYSM